MTVHVCAGPEGCVLTVTSNDERSASGVENENVPSAPIGRSSPLLSCSVSPVPARPETMPPTLNLSVTQSTSTLVTFPLASLPEPDVTLHVCLGFDGCI